MAITLNGTEGLRVPSISAGNLVGQVCFFAMQTAPDGFLVCDGSLVSRLTYAELFAAIGTLYGAGDGSTTFRLPDLRGEFIRGWDGGRGIDSGRGFATVQADENKSHTHSGTTSSNGAHNHDPVWNGGGNSGSTVYSGIATTPNATGWRNMGAMSNSGAHTHTLSIENTGGAEEKRFSSALH